MGFQTIEVFKFFSKHFKQNITILELEIKLFFHYFAVVKYQKDIVDR
jgi:hypothetical protein